MGEIAEMMLEGLLCEGCGEFMGESARGYPVRCSACGPGDAVMFSRVRQAAPQNAKRNRNLAKPSGRKFACDKCSRLCRTEAGLAQHKLDKHSESPSQDWLARATEGIDS